MARSCRAGAGLRPSSGRSSRATRRRASPPCRWPRDWTPAICSLTYETKVGEKETAGELFDRLAQAGAELLTETLVQLDEIIPRPQDDAQSCYAHMLDKQMAVIDWSKSAHEIDCLIRGLNPWPIALTSLAGERLKVFAAEPVSGKGAPGAVLEADPKKGLTVACGEGALRLTRFSSSAASA